jgi:hypothetical protein
VATGMARRVGKLGDGSGVSEGLGDAVFRAAVFFFDFGVTSFAVEDFFFGTFGVSSGVSFGVGFGGASSPSDFFGFAFGDGEGDLCAEVLCFVAGDPPSSGVSLAFGFGEDNFALLVDALCFADGVGDWSGSGVTLSFGFGLGVGEVCFFVAFLAFGFGVGVSSADVTAWARRTGVGFSSSVCCALTPTAAIMKMARTKETKRRTAAHANRADRAINPERFRL